MSGPSARRYRGANWQLPSDGDPNAQIGGTQTNTRGWLPVGAVGKGKGKCIQAHQYGEFKQHTAMRVGGMLGVYQHCSLATAIST